MGNIGFIWDVNAGQWDKGFFALETFVAEHGYAKTIDIYRNQEGFKLGQWVAVQRANKEKLYEDRRHRPDELGFVWDAINV